MYVGTYVAPDVYREVTSHGSIVATTTGVATTSSSTMSLLILKRTLRKQQDNA